LKPGAPPKEKKRDISKIAPILGNTSRKLLARA
jgi:hypothetical protein